MWITWIQTNFQKHFRAIFAVLLAVTIVAFIFTIGAAPGIGQADRQISERPFFGRNLGNDTQNRLIFQDAELSSTLKAGYPALNSNQLQTYGFQRVAGLALANELHLPAPTDDQLAKYITTLPAFQNEQGQFDQGRYSRFADALKSDPQFTAADVTRVLREDARLEQVDQLIGGPGYVLPGDVKTQLLRADSVWTVAVATIDYASYDPGFNPTEEAVKKYFEDNSFRYEVPPRTNLSYIEYKAADFTVGPNPSEAEVRAYYDANPTRFAPPAEPDKKDTSSIKLAPVANTADTYAAVRMQVEAALLQELAMKRAAKAANDFTLGLYERKFSPNSPALDAFLATQKLSPVALPPFTPAAPPPNAPWLGNYAAEISRLSAQRYFSDPLPTPTGLAVLIWKETLPSYKPVLSEVRDKVAADCKESEKRKRFIEHGRALRVQLEAAIKSGTPFDQAAATKKLEVKSFSSFTLRQPPKDFPYVAFSALQTLEAGRIAEMVATADQGYLVYAQEKKAPDLSASSPQYATTRQQLMRFTAGMNQSAYLGELVTRELAKTEPAKQPQ
ncbi:MAG: peptidyl-prolyl cis-trans isomerase [Opitutaceae bacterium]|nr:peptidyl-prolyl cis-trans isomerase [Opitutaceae bacterium]